MIHMGDEISLRDADPEAAKPSNPVWNAYDGVCPDCGEPIPEGIQEGQECCNCGHVFWPERKDD
jgi:hypothetical protein